MQQQQWLKSEVIVDFLNFLTDAWTDGSFSHSWVSRSVLHTGLPMGQSQTIKSMQQALEVFGKGLPHVPPYQQCTLAQHAQSLQTQYKQLLQHVKAAAQAVNAGYMQAALPLCQTLLLEINHRLGLCGHAKLSLSKSDEVLLQLPQFCYDLQAFMQSMHAEIPASIQGSPWLSGAAAPLAALLIQPLQLSDVRVTLGLAVLVRSFWQVGTRSLQLLPQPLRFSWDGPSNTQDPNPSGHAVFPKLSRMSFTERLLEQQRLHWLLHAWQQQLTEQRLFQAVPTAQVAELIAVASESAGRYLLSAALYTVGYAAWPHSSVQKPLQGLRKTERAATGIATRTEASSAASHAVEDPEATETDPVPPLADDLNSLLKPMQAADIKAFQQEQADIDASDLARERWLTAVRRLTRK